MNAHKQAIIRKFILFLLANEMNRPETDIAERFYFGALEPKMEYPL